MDSQKGDQYEYDADKYLERVSGVYIFDKSSGLYKPKTSHSKSHSQRKTQDSEHVPPLRVNVSRDWVTLVISILTLIVVGIYTYYAGRQRDEMVASNRINSDALTSVQRAFITHKSVDYVPAIAPPGIEFPGVGKAGFNGFRFTVSWENSGTTPASGVLTYFSIDKSFSSHFVFQVKQGTVFQKTVMGPKSVTTSGPIFEPDEFWKPITGEPYVYFWGWAIYRDAFPTTKPHATEFCQQLASISKPLPGAKKRPNAASPIDFEPIACAQHNCADEDCEDYGTLVSLWKTQQPIMKVSR